MACSNTNDKIKSDLSDDFTKGTNNYPETRQQTLLKLDQYTKKPLEITASEGTVFVKRGNKSGKNSNKAKGDNKEKESSEYDKEYFKDKMCFRCGKKGHPKSACTEKMAKDNESSRCNKSSKSSKSTSNNKDKKIMARLSKGFKMMGKAMSQIHEDSNISSDKGSTEHSHFTMAAVCGTAFTSESVSAVQGKKYLFAAARLSLRNHVLLDNQSSVHVMCNPEFVMNIRVAAGEMQLKSNGGK